MPHLNSLVRQSIHSAGGMRVFRFANRKGVRVLMYHRFSEDTKDLEWQCEHICRNYHPISLDNYGDAIANGHSVPFNSLIVTVDDGYRDFLYVHPLFQCYGIPSTVYLVSDFIDGKLWLWWNQLEYAFLNSTHTLLKLSLEGKEMTFSFETAEQRVLTCRHIAEAMTRVEDSERLRLLQLIPELLEIEIPSKPPPQWAPLEWEEVRKLIHEGVSFGAHTKTHTILSRLRDPSKQEEEITQSKLRIEEQVGQNVRHFCYPNGAFSDFDEHSVSLVRSLGFETATTTERGLNFPGSEPLLLRRLGVEPDLPRNYFAELLAGARRE
jgi:peptidoglycan/xylan/chitin deacetylase (PgdA/CDA1 family)